MDKPILIFVSSKSGGYISILKRDQNNFLISFVSKIENMRMNLDFDLSSKEDLENSIFIREFYSCLIKDSFNVFGNFSESLFLDEEGKILGIDSDNPEVFTFLSLKIKDDRICNFSLIFDYQRYIDKLKSVSEMIICRDNFLETFNFLSKNY